MESTILTSKCLRKSNILDLVEEVMSRINLTANSRARLEVIITEEMKNFLQKIDGVPRNDAEALAVKEKLNVIVANSVCNIIEKKYPKRRTQTQSNTLARDMTVHGQRPNMYNQRPKYQSKKDGYADVNSAGCSYAPAFSNYSFVDDNMGNQIQSRGGSDVEQRYQEMLASRKMDNNQYVPQHIDFSLDGSGKRPQNIPEQPREIDPYDMLLGAGAPSQMPTYQQPMPVAQGMGPMFQM